MRRLFWIKDVSTQRDGNFRQFAWTRMLQTYDAAAMAFRNAVGARAQ